jgi:hypothetical protein
MKPLFVVISGKKQVGKDTSAALLKKIFEEDGLSVELIALAKPLKTFCKDVLRLTDEQLSGTNEQKNSLTKYKWDNMPMEIRERYSLEEECPSDGHLPDGPRVNGTRRTPRSGYMTAREVIQTFGTDIIRNYYDDDTWANCVFDRTYDTDVVIVTDCRFSNEKAAADRNDAITILITRDTGFTDTHSTEHGLSDETFDYHHANDDSIDKLYNFLKGLALCK